MTRGMRRLCTAGLAALALVFASPASAHHNRQPRLRTLTDPRQDAELVVDAATGRVLYARNDDAIRHPASLTKMMTLYLVFEKLREHKIALDTQIPVSAYAASQPRAHLKLKAGETMTLEDAIKAIVICSANDVAVAVAEAVAGGEPQFAEMMNAKAREFGMSHTYYENASGLPNESQVTTAGDLAILAWHLIYDLPEYYPYFRTSSWAWEGRSYNTHDFLISNYPGTDGIKTGYIDESGYNIVTTVQRGGTRLIAVVMGGVTPGRRDKVMVGLLDQAFAELQIPRPGD
ncbi:MAG TPA: D-alanyl-D-alanine carboxypeptidase family protein [Rhizomicrobium sp.]|nr:D-alanyl-D-alanine carboxypeptidase family protein [Rhizomicrobium sp.]